MIKSFYCVGTHWDREWYEPFQEFRMWLVELIDELMDLMDRDTEYKNFHLDGQTVVLQDYLEIRPERRERLVEMIRAGRLIVGPWYNLPDEWLISGESFVRNMLMGARVCRELGVTPMKFAYTPDQFGHVAALPMIMAGFGLEAGICWRGTQDETFPAHFIWVGPDGSRMAYHKLMDSGSYSPFGMCVRDPIKKENWSEESYGKYFEDLLGKERQRTDLPLVLLLDAIDHQRPDPAAPSLLQELRKRYPNVDFRWASLEEYGAEMLKYKDRMPERKGELREPCREADRAGQYLIAHTISSRYPLKQHNDECQALLERWAEPCALFHLISRAGSSDSALIKSYLRKSWEYLLRCHSHDSICGCSIDQVHQDMAYRFDQSRMIADGVVRRMIAAMGQASADENAWSNVVVHNPLPFARHGVFDLSIPFPCDWPKTYVDGLTSAERINKFVFVDSSGHRVPFQLSSIERGLEQKVLQNDGRRATRVCDVYHLSVEMGLPSCGYSGLRIEPTDEATRTFGTLMTGPMAAANETISFSLRSDGHGELSLAGSPRTFADLFLYEDRGDSGDGWTHGQLVNDIVFRGPGTRVATGIDEDGPLRTIFRVEREFELPQSMDRRTCWRSEARATLRVVDRISVERGLPCLRVRTHVENTCMDHRFRVLFPTGIDAATSFAETPFAVVDRDIDIPPDSASWHERINPEKAFTTFFGVQEQSGGLAVLAPFGLHEYEVLQTPKHTLALTLFRATWKTVGTPGEWDGELLGPLDFEYLLFPFTGCFDPVRALRIVQEAQTGVRAHTASSLPKDDSFLRVSPGHVVVTALKPAEGDEGGIIRLWNPGPLEAREEIALKARICSASLCDLGEKPVAAIPLTLDGNIPVTVPPYGLATVAFVWSNE